jgi:hypothetical protein
METPVNTGGLKGGGCSQVSFLVEIENSLPEVMHLGQNESMFNVVVRLQTQYNKYTMNIYRGKHLPQVS